MSYPGEKPHVFVQVEPGVLWPEFCAHCGDARDHPVHNVKSAAVDEQRKDGN